MVKCGGGRVCGEQRGRTYMCSHMNTFCTHHLATSEGEAAGGGRESKCDRGKTTTKK